MIFACSMSRATPCIARMPRFRVEFAERVRTSSKYFGFLWKDVPVIISGFFSPIFLKAFSHFFVCWDISFHVPFLFNQACQSARRIFTLKPTSSKFFSFKIVT